ncbi:MAG: S-methyl-5-thioribose-1-phosphate isomerase [Bacteriovorax sp.]|jgi:methylthioribose-1-phosphate isomerase|nr:S-methyl-5-thioribose-1-phosphate isomerase [Bacteriovorax sp.]
MSGLLPLKYENEIVKLLDQRLLPTEEIYLTAKTIEDCFDAIKDMVVRGAPLIGFTGIWGLALFLKHNPKITFEQFSRAAEYLKSARPTAVNLAYEIDRCVIMAKAETHMNALYPKLVAHAKNEMNNLYEKNLMMAKLGEVELQKIYGDRPLNIMTICNTGVLACGVLGTALGVIVHLNNQKKIKSVYASETRPYLQGSRLTSFELIKEGIDHRIVVEGAASYLMKNKMVDAIFAGADRIVENGDTANKIGTSSLSIIAKHYGIPFYIVAPISTFDLNLATGDQIEIELRDQDEILKYKDKYIAHPEARALNPSFDVTDHRCITGIICEKGVIYPTSPANVRAVVEK